VRLDVVVVDAPALDDGAGLGQDGEDLLVQALVAEPAVEAFDEAVLLHVRLLDETDSHSKRGIRKGAPQPPPDRQDWPAGMEAGVLLSDIQGDLQVEA
jgi:hypothetical protein